MFPHVPLKEIVKPINRMEVPIPGMTYRQIGVRLWGEGAYERESIDGSETKYKTLSQMQEDDIVVNKIWARNGSVAVVTKPLAGTYGSSEFPTFAPNRDYLEPRWFHWLTKTKWFWGQCDLKSRGTSGKNRISPENFLQIEIPLPPFPEQRRIVAKLEALAAKIEEAHCIRKDTALKSEFAVLSAARDTLSRINAKVTTVRDWIDTDREGIKTGPFGAQLGRGDFRDNGVPIITIGNVQYNGLLFDKLFHVTEEKASELGSYIVREGDILFARMGTVGRCCVVPKEAEGWLFNYHIIRLALDRSKIEPRFLHWTIRASTGVTDYLSKAIRGATRAGVNSKIVSSLPCRVPSIEEQRRIVAYLDGLQAQVDALKNLQNQTASELDALLPAVLNRAFKGEL